MQIFISWSGERSKHIANALRAWLPNVIQALSPFISTQDIAKGARGTVVISENLERSNLGVICLTPENLTAPWVLFEAGALAKLQTEGAPCTYLFEVEPGDVKPPLGQFQHTRANKEDTRALVISINSRLGESRLDAARLLDSFERWWPDLEEALKNVPPKAEGEKEPEPRDEADKIDELLGLVRRLATSSADPRPAHWKRVSDDAALLNASLRSPLESKLDRAIYVAVRLYLDSFPPHARSAILNDGDYLPRFVNHVMEYLQLRGLPADRQDVQERLRRLIDNDRGLFPGGSVTDPSS